VSHGAHRRSLLLLVSPLLLASCYSFAEPSFHPGDARQVMSAIARRGVDIGTTTAGESACDDPSLIPNVMHLQGSVASDPTQRDVWVYTFREKYWTSSQAAVDACQATYQDAHPGAVITRVDIPTYRVFGADWSTELADSVRGGLKEASQEGEPQ
jgi:hypothetical protein